MNAVMDTLSLEGLLNMLLSEDDCFRSLVFLPSAPDAPKPYNESQLQDV